MKRLIFILMITCSALLVTNNLQAADKVSTDAAQRVAQNWLALVLENKGHFGHCQTAEVGKMFEFKRDDRLLGYLFQVEPRGFIVVSLYEVLAPVKAWSGSCDLDPASDEGFTGLLKDGLEGVLDAIEQTAGPIDTLDLDEIGKHLEIDYRVAWGQLSEAPGVFANQQLTGGKKMNYEEGDILLDSWWSQDPPYNDDCPNMSCSWPDYNNFNQNAVVGCVATAGAQIMRYWNWPPYGQGSPYSDTYDWINMLDQYVFHWTPTPGFYDHSGNPVTQAQIDAVAELSAEVGQAVGMSYSCTASGAYTYDMEGVYENSYRYSPACHKRNRSDYGNAIDWFNNLKTQFNANRPVHYRVKGHSIVGDGWLETGNPVLRQYHMNYGWDDGYNGWYTLDALHLGGINEEYVLQDILPACYLGATLSGTYAKQSFPYRYVDRDTACSGSATFSAGQKIQFLPEVDMKCTSTTGGSIRILGAPSSSTLLFTRGDQTRGMKILNGAVKMHKEGSIMFPDS
jgi:hypothetical protein